MKFSNIEVSESRYVIDGQEYVRLSEAFDILPSQWLERWKKKVGEEEAERIMTEAADWGTLVHLVCEMEDRKDYESVDRLLNLYPDLIPFWVAWRNWVEKYVECWILIEQVVKDDKLGVAGRIDRTGIIKGDDKPSIVDIKTGTVSAETGIRLAGYKLMHNQIGKNKKKWVDRTIAVNMPRKEPGELKVIEFESESLYKPLGITFTKAFAELASDYRTLFLS